MEPKQFYIAGVQHHNLKSCLRYLKKGDALELVPEPSNKYDPNAIRIEHNEPDETFMTGYVPRKFSSEISGSIEIGKRLECKIIELTPSAKPWEMCKVEIKEVEDV